MKTGISLLELCDSITKEFSSLMKDFFTDNSKIVKWCGKEIQYDTNRLTINEEINHSLIMDIVLNTSGQLIVGIRRKNDWQIYEYDKLETTTRVKIMLMVLNHYQFSFKKEYINKS